MKSFNITRLEISRIKDSPISKSRWNMSDCNKTVLIFYTMSLFENNLVLRELSVETRGPRNGTGRDQFVFEESVKITKSNEIFSSVCKPQLLLNINSLRNNYVYSPTVIISFKDQKQYGAHFSWNFETSLPQGHLRSLVRSRKFLFEWTTRIWNPYIIASKSTPDSLEIILECFVKYKQGGCS